MGRFRLVLCVLAATFLSSGSLSLSPLALLFVSDFCSCYLLVFPLQAFLDTPAIVARAAAQAYGAEAYHPGASSKGGAAAARGAEGVPAVVSRRAQRDVAASAQHVMEEEVFVRLSRPSSFFVLGCFVCAFVLHMSAFVPSLPCLIKFFADHGFFLMCVFFRCAMCVRVRSRLRV